MTIPWLKPATLRPGDRVAVVAPAGLVPRLELLSGLVWLRQRYEVVWSESAFLRTGYLAGSDAIRGDSLGRAFADPETKAVFAARGGYGAMRILDKLPVSGDRAEDATYPWLIGFSDVTALHVVCQLVNVCTLHAPNVTGLRRAHPADRHRLLACLEGRDVAPWSGLELLVGADRLASGPAEGRAAGGNLAMLYAMAAADARPSFDGAVLFLEDITEKPYRIDRMITALHRSGALDRVAAVVCGGFELCDPGSDGVTVKEVIAERLRPLGVPVLWNAPFGHGARNQAIVLGAHVRVEVDDGQGVVSFGARNGASGQLPAAGL